MRLSSLYLGFNGIGKLIIAIAVVLAILTGLKRSKSEDKPEVERIVIQESDLRESRVSRNQILVEWLEEMALKGKLDEIFTKNKEAKLETEILGD